MTSRVGGGGLNRIRYYKIYFSSGRECNGDWPNQLVLIVSACIASDGVHSLLISTRCVTRFNVGSVHAWPSCIKPMQLAKAAISPNFQATCIFPCRTNIRAHLCVDRLRSVSRHGRRPSRGTCRSYRLDSHKPSHPDASFFQPACVSLTMDLYTSQVILPHGLGHLSGGTPPFARHDITNQAILAKNATHFEFEPIFPSGDGQWPHPHHFTIPHWPRPMAKRRDFLANWIRLAMMESHPAGDRGEDCN